MLDVGVVAEVVCLHSLIYLYLYPEIEDGFKCRINVEPAPIMPVY